MIKIKSKIWYSMGNPFKKRFRRHYCFMCGNELSIKKHRKIVHSKSEEAKYYDFSIGENYAIGNVEFIHKILCCNNCSYDIEYLTQIGMEDYIKWEDKAFNIISKKNIDCLNIQKIWLDDEGTEHFDRPSLNKINCYIVRIKDLNIDIICSKKYQSNNWERPYYLSKYRHFKSELKKINK